MSKIKLNLEYPTNENATDLSQEAVDKARAEVSRGYIEYALTAHFKDGASREERRKIGRLQVSIDKSIEDKTYAIEVEGKDLILLQDAFLSEKVKFPASISQYVVKLEDEILKDIK
jgi:hypothetical protein